MTDPGQPLAVLIDPEEAERRRTCPDDREINAIRNALRRYDAITNVFRPDGAELPEPNLAKLEHLVRFGWMAFQASNYQAVGQVLADLIRDAQAAVWQLDGDQRRQAQTWLAWTYQLAAETAFKLGDAQLGWVAADRGIQLAEQTGDLTLIGSAARRVGHALMATHQGGDAVALIKSAAHRLEPQLRTAAPAFVSAFGTTNVLVHRVSALADMHGGRVVEAAAEIPIGDLMRLPRERRVSHLLDVTRGHLQAGQRDEAATTLLDAHQLAPEEVRCRPKTTLIITDLVRSYPHGTTPMVAVTRLARAVGVAV